MSQKSFPTKIHLAAEVRASVTAILNQHLADILDLRSQTKNAHWNVKGPHFYSLHLLFDTLAESLDDPIDELAERITALGGVAHGSTRDVAKTSRVTEYPAGTHDGLKLVAALVERWGAVANTARAAIDETDSLGDKDTADLFTGISRDLDKHVWFLESHLQGDR
ncbi:MAG: DNA starvation/stationary phase protection protein Dps [Bacteroidales bacterium]|nr:DNA starvation/stationary phase protection protein Dps [Bacteroidales bacterium]